MKDVKSFSFSYFAFSILSILLYLNTKAQTNLICNGGFEDYVFPPGANLAPQSQVPCWSTSSSMGMIEVWTDVLNPTPFEGRQFVEINAFGHDTLYQDFSVSGAGGLLIKFAHRGRNGVDVMGVQVGPVGGPYTVLGQYADPDSVWGYHSASYTIPSGAFSNFRIKLYSIATSGNMASMGNFLDSVTVIASTTSIDEHLLAGTCIYPNPANDVIHIKNIPVGTSLSIFDVTGKIVHKSITETGETHINTNSFAEGTYFVQLKNNEVLTNKKLIINR